MYICVHLYLVIYIYVIDYDHAHCRMMMIFNTNNRIVPHLHLFFQALRDLLSFTITASQRQHLQSDVIRAMARLETVLPQTERSTLWHKLPHVIEDVLDKGVRTCNIYAHPYIQIALVS